jgi:hypothetical protein
MIKSLDKKRKLNTDFIKKQLESPESNNAKLIIEKSKELCGKYVDFNSCHYGYLLGVTCGCYDYYWLFIDDKLKIRYSSCVCNPIPLDKIPNIKYNTSDYIIKNNAESIIDKIKDSFNNCDDVMMTPVYINGKEYIIEY